MALWQYKVMPFTAYDDAADLENNFNTIGLDQWEVFQIRQEANSASFVAKRQGAWTVAPVNKAAATLDRSTAAAGDTITCHPGIWEGGVMYFEYQWKRGGTVDIPGATSKQYMTVPIDAGESIMCHVRVTNSIGEAFSDTPYCAVH